MLQQMESLRAEHPWPAERPDLPRDGRGWFHPSNADLLGDTIAEVKPKVIVEIGSWLGLSTRWLCAKSDAHVIAVDHWEGSEEHQSDPAWAELLPRLHEQFLANCWEYRDRLTPVRIPSPDGLLEIARHGVRADLVYVDGAHDTDSVISDIETALACFPGAVITGDDWTWGSVQQGVRTVARSRNLGILSTYNCWRLL